VYQYKFFSPVLLLLSAVICQADDGVYSATWKRQVFGSMRDAFGSGPTTATIVSLAGLVIVFILLVVLLELRKAQRRRNSSDSLGWERFREKATQLRLTASETEALAEIIRTANLGNADSALNSPTVFENVLEKYYDLNGRSLEESDYAEVRALRERVGFTRLSNEIPYVSTRQIQQFASAPAVVFESGQVPPVHDSADTRPGRKWMASILRVTEKYWAVSRPEGVAVVPGSWVRINITRPGDAEYRIRTQVVADIEGELRLAHTRDLSRNQLRNWVRVDVDLPAKVFRIFPGEIHDRVEEMMVGHIRDLSGGGLSLSLATRLERGAYIDLEFELPGHGLLKGVRGRITRVQGPLHGDSTKIVHSATFEGELKAIQKRIIHFVFEKQRQEARMRSIS